MQHDIFLGLFGIKNNLFILNSNVTDPFSLLSLNQSLCYLHPGEVYILEKLCTLANSYAAYDKFTSSESFYIRAPGLYMQALVQGLSEIMFEYRLTVLNLEKKYRNSFSFPLSYLYHGLDEYFYLFPALDSLLSEVINSKRSHGCILMDIVERRISIGDIRIRSAIHIIFSKMQSVLFKQISIWCIHGIISDLHEEFFIHTSKPDGVINDGSLSIPSEYCIYEPSIDNYDICSKFVIQKALLPSCISQSIADKILFVGEAVFHFSFSSNERSKLGVQMDEINNFRLNGLLADCEHELNDNLIQILEQGYFWQQRLERQLDILKSRVNNEVITLIYNRGNFLSQLKILKDFFLLGRGELFMTFLDTVMEKECQNPKLKVKDINDIFSQLLVHFHFDTSNVKYPIQFRFTTEIPNFTNSRFAECFSTLIRAKSEKDILGEFIFSCIIEWPLQALINPGVISHYQLIFHFLIKIRKAHMCLLEVWKNYRKACACDRIPTTIQAGQPWNMLEINYHMRYLLDTLQYYVFSDVIEVQYNIFLSKIKHIQDFEQLILMHDKFLLVLIEKLFISSDWIFPAILQILEFVERLHKISKEDSRMVAFQFNCLKTQFNIHCLSFYKKFKLNESHLNPNLAIFLMRMDYNQFYTNHLRSPDII